MINLLGRTGPVLDVETASFLLNMGIDLPAELADTLNGKSLLNNFGNALSRNRGDC